MGLICKTYSFTMLKPEPRHHYQYWISEIYTPMHTPIPCHFTGIFGDYQSRMQAENGRSCVSDRVSGVRLACHGRVSRRERGKKGIGFDVLTLLERDSGRGGTMTVSCMTASLHAFVCIAIIVRCMHARRGVRRR